jgi:hypothetical protein
VLLSATGQPHITALLSEYQNTTCVLLLITDLFNYNRNTCYYAEWCKSHLTLQTAC